MRFKFLLICLLLIFSTILGMAHRAKAQVASSNSIDVNIVPPNPAPYENTQVKLSSYAYNLDSVLITWSVDGKSSLSGIGKKSFSLTAPAAGAESTVVAKIALPDGNVELRVAIRPAVMVMLWQANDSYVPPFYKGKAMASEDSEVKIVAMPELRSGGTQVSPKNMTYAWTKDYTNNQEGSGYGKNFFIYSNDFLEGENIVGVVAQTTDGKTSSEAKITVATRKPEIIFYKNSKEWGTVWESALLSPYQVIGGETVMGVPYFISPKNLLNPTLSFTWFINNNAVNILGFRKNVIPLKVEEGASGRSTLRLDIENRDKVFQSTSKQIDMEF